MFYYLRVPQVFAYRMTQWRLSESINRSVVWFLFDRPICSLFKVLKKDYITLTNLISVQIKCRYYSQYCGKYRFQWCLFLCFLLCAKTTNHMRLGWIIKLNFFHNLAGPSIQPMFAIKLLEKHILFCIVYDISLFQNVLRLAEHMKMTGVLQCRMLWFVYLSTCFYYFVKGFYAVI